MTISAFSCGNPKAYIFLFIGGPSYHMEVLDDYFKEPLNQRKNSELELPSSVEREMKLEEIGGGADGVDNPCMKKKGKCSRPRKIPKHRVPK